MNSTIRIPDDLIRVTEAAKRLHVCPNTIKRAIFNDELAGWKIGGWWRVSALSVNIYLKKRRP